MPSQKTLGGGGKFTPKKIPGLALWLDASDTSSLWTTDAGAVTPIADPTKISGCVLWLDGADSSLSSMVLSGSFVAVWRDKSGNSNNAFANGTTRPVLTPNGLNGQTVVTFDGADDALQIPANAAFNSNDLTYIVVFKQASAGNKGVYTKSNAAAGANGFALATRSDPSVWLLQKNNNQSQVLSASTNPSAQARIYSVVSTSSATGYVDGQSSASASSTADHSLSQRVMVGSRDTTEFFNGYIAEVVHYNRALTRSELAQVEAYLGSKWGVSSVHSPASKGSTAVSTPLELQGCVGWWDASDLSSMRQNSDGTGSVLAGDLVGWWQDKSPIGATVTGSGTARPTLSATGFNSKQALVFNGSSTNLSNPSYTATNSLSGLTVIAVCGNTSGVANLSRVYPAGFQGLWMNGTRRFYVDDSNNVNFSSSGASGVNTLAPGMYAYRFASSAIENYETGSLIAGTVNGTIPSTTGSSASAALHIGSNIGANAFWNGPIAEYIIFNRALDRTELARLHSYLAAKWGISGVPDPAPPVASWVDKSGAKRNITQPTSDYRPVAQLKAVANRPALKFDGTNDWLVTGNIASAFPTAATVFVVCYPSTSSNTGWSAFSTGNNGWDIYAGSLCYSGAFRNPRVQGLPSPLRYNSGEPLILRYRSSSSSWTQFVNGNLAVEATPAFQAASSNYSPLTGNPGIPYTFGADLSGGTINGAFKDYICEVLMYNTALSDSSCRQVERYLANKWRVNVKPSVSNADAQSWVDRVYANGGTVSATTAAAVNQFCTAIEAAGIRDRFYRLNLFCGGASGTPTGLAACLTPLYRGPSISGPQYGGALDTAVSLAASDYAETGALGGLTANATTNTSKMLNTGLNGSELTPGNRHVSAYEIVNATTDYSPSVLSGSVLATQHGIGPWVSASTISYRTHNTVGGAATATKATGLWLGSDTSSTSSVLYNNAAQVATASGASAGGSGNTPYYVLGSSIGEYSEARLGAYSIGLSMSAQDVSKFYDALRVFQVALGRDRASSDPAFSAITNEDAKAWIDSVYANGGSVTVAAATAVNAFCDKIDAAGIRSRFYRLNLFAGNPDGSLLAVRTPLYRGPTTYTGRNLIATVPTAVQFSGASWVNNFGAGTANQAKGALVAAPDETVTAQSITFANAGAVRYTPSWTAGATGTISFWARRPASGGATHIRITTNNTLAWNTGISEKFALTTSWQRFSTTGALSTGSSVHVIVGGNTVSGGSDADCNGTVELWSPQLEYGSLSRYEGPQYGSAMDTAVNFASTDYSLATGLTGNSSSGKYLSTTFPANTIPSNNLHMAAGVLASAPGPAMSYLLGLATTGANNYLAEKSVNGYGVVQFGTTQTSDAGPVGTVAAGRFLATYPNFIFNGSSQPNFASTFETPATSNPHYVFAANGGSATTGSATGATSSRLGYYSIGNAFAKYNSSGTSLEAEAFDNAIVQFMSAIGRS